MKNRMLDFSSGEISNSLPMKDFHCSLKSTGMTVSVLILLLLCGILWSALGAAMQTCTQHHTNIL